MIKKYLMAAMFSVFALALTAGTGFAAEKEKLTVVIAGSPSGTFNLTTRLFNEYLKTVYDVTLIPADGCANGFSFIRSTDDQPMIYVAAADDVARFELGTRPMCGLELTREAFLITAWVNTQSFCTTNDSGFTWETFIDPNTTPTVGVPKNLIAIKESLTKYFGKAIKWVPYKSSGALYRGLIAGDIDYAILNSLRAHRGTAGGNFTCFASSEDLGTLMPNPGTEIQWRNYTPFFVSNMTPEQKATLLRHVQDAMDTPALLDYYSTGAEKATETPDEQYVIFRQAVVDWKANQPKK